MNNYLIDTHCHLNLSDDIDTILMEAENNNVNKLIISGCDKKSIRNGLEIVYRYPSIYMTIGFHPDEVDELTDQDISDLEKLILTNKKIIGIGEIGLDYYHNDMNIDKQKEYFRKQLDLASKYNLPVVIHSRDSIQDIYDILKEYQLKGVIHCFSGSIEMAELFIKLGYKLGVGGVLTFKNSHLKEIVEELPIENFVLETDSPYLAPEPHRGHTNYPKNVKIVAQAMSKIKNININDVMQETTKNALEIYKIN